MNKVLHVSESVQSCMRAEHKHQLKICSINALYGLLFSHYADDNTITSVDVNFCILVFALFFSPKFQGFDLCSDASSSINP